MSHLVENNNSSENGLRVLSLFDGISCGRIALDRAGFKVKDYYAYEIEQNAIKISRYNYPSIYQCGDVFEENFSKYLDGGGIDILMGGSPCFAKDTMILTKRGIIPIQNVEVGDLVWTHRDRWRKVISIGNKEAMTYKLKCQGVYETIVTSNHPYYIRKVKRKYSYYKDENGEWKTGKSTRLLQSSTWKQVNDLEKGDFVASPIITTSENKFNLTKEECWILGRYVADGHIRHDKRKNRINSYYYSVILSIGSHKLDYVKEKIKTYHYSCYPHTKSVHRVVISNQKLVEFILNNDFGQGAINKNIPSFILELPIEYAKEFLDGYWSGDGGHNPMWDCESATTISRRLAFSLALLIQKVYKVNTSITYTKVNPQKIIEGRIVNQKPQYTVRFRTEMRKQTIAMIDDNKVWLPYKKIEENNITIVYNLSVEDDESYVANNYIVHNCQFWASSKCSKTAKKKREVKPDGEGWNLFMQYVRALHESKPKYFLYENNYGIGEEIQAAITKELCVEPVLLDSQLVSAQRRKRLYWTNIPIKGEPEDKGILVKDVIVNDSELIKKFDDRIRNTLVKCENYIKYDLSGKGHFSQQDRMYFLDNKAPTVPRCRTETKFNVWLGGETYKKTCPVEIERLQTLPDGYTEFGLNEDGSIVKMPKTRRFEAIGNGWTVDMIAWIFSFMKK